MQVRPPLVSTPGSAQRRLRAFETWIWPAVLLGCSAALLGPALHPRWLALVWQVRDLSDAQWPADFTRLRLWLDAAQLGLAALSAALLLRVGGRQRYAAALGVLGVGLATSQLWPVSAWLSPGAWTLLSWTVLGAAWSWGVFDLRRLERPGRVSRVVLWGYGAVLIATLIWTFGAVSLELSGAATDQVPPGLLWNELIRPGLRDFGLAALLLCAVLAAAEQSPGAVRGGVMRALVFGGLSLGTALLFSVVVGGLSALLHTSGTLWPSLAAAGLVAALIEPARSALSRSLRKLLYGERDDPSGVMQGLARQLEGSGSAAPMRGTLEDALASVAAALRLPFLALHFADGEVLSFGAPPAQSPESLPLIAQGERLGTLEVARRRAREPFSKAEWALLEGVARQLAVSAHAWHLARQLQASQDHLIRAGEEERRRLRRDLHDGLGPSLAGLGLKLEAARMLLGRSPERAAEHLSALRIEVQESVSEVRRLVHDLRPPKLDDLGLIGSLEEVLAGARQAGLAATLELDALPPLGAALEVAVYRIAQEALTNVMKHARASQVTLRLESAAGELILECCDNGVGLPEVREPGVGSRSMRERAGALSGTLELAAGPAGGTVVRARLPLAAVRPGL